MNSRPLIIVFGMLVLNLLSYSVQAQSYTTSDGHQFTVSVKAEKATLMFAETTFLVFEIKNNSNKDLYFGDGGDYRNNIGRPESYSVKVTRDDGKPVAQPEVTLSMGGLLGSQQVPVNGSYVRKLFLPHWATFEGPGNYNITVQRALGIRARPMPGKDQLEVPSEFKSVKTTASTKIKIIETDNAKLGEVISELGDRMLAEKYYDDARNELLLLDFIKDERTIEYWLRALELYSSSSDWDVLQRYRQTPVILAKYDTVESMPALEAAMKSNTDDVRLDVADALSISKDPRALPLLWRMHTDSYWFVRLRVVQAFGTQTTNESTDKLLLMLDDENDYVWKEAEKYLKTRNALPENLPLRPLEKLECSIRGTISNTPTQSEAIISKDSYSDSGVFIKKNCATALKDSFEELRSRHEKDDVPGEAWFLYQIADLYSQARRYQEAYDHYLLALPLVRQLKDNEVERYVVRKLANASELLNLYPQALTFLNQELAIVKASNDPESWAEENILDNIADVYFKSGDDASGFEYLQKLLSLNRQKGLGEALVLNRIGTRYEKIGQKANALKYYRESLEVYEKSIDSRWYGASVEELRKAIKRLEQ